jgi:glutamine synthetase
MTSASTAAATDVVRRAQHDGVEFVSLQFTDVVGAVKSVDLPVGRLEEALERGVWFDGSSIEGFARIHESDMVLQLDPGTYQILPWSAATRRRARIICDIYTPDGTPFAGDPRGALRRVTARARELGFIYNIGPELEFFLLHRGNGESILPVPHDIGGYFDFSGRDAAQSVRSDITLALQAMGITVEMLHHEVAAGQHEIDFQYADALHTADNAITLKYTVKAIAAQHDLLATFMPKPIFGINGSGMHVHQSLAGPGDGQNLFYDPEGQFKLAPLARHFIAGQLAHARAMAAIVAPTVNSYKRLVPGYEAPVYVCWAQINRSALIRIPRFSPGRERATRAELRFPDPSCNPYLAFAVMLAAGLDGIARQLEPPDPVNEDVYHFSDEELDARGIATLPDTLGQALVEFEADPALCDALGAHLVEAFVRAKREEWEQYRLRVSNWEVERYLETA